MSFPHTRAVWEIEDLDPLEKLLLLSLAHSADDAGLCWPSLTALEERTGLCRASVCAKLDALERRGLLSRRKGRPGVSTRYTLLFRGVERSAKDSLSPETAQPRGAGSPYREPQVVHHMDQDSPRHGSRIVHHVDGGSPSRGPESINEPIKTNPTRKRSAGEPDAEGGEDSLRLANGVTLDLTVPEEVRRLWPEWLAYRAERHTARGREKLAWTLQTARMSAESVARACERHPARVVADRIRAAIEGRWQGLNLDRLETPRPPGGTSGAGPASVRVGGLRAVRGGGL